MHATHRDLEANENDGLKSRKVDEYAYTHTNLVQYYGFNVQRQKERFTH